METSSCWIRAKKKKRRSAFHYCYCVSVSFLTQSQRLKMQTRPEKKGKANCVHCTGWCWASGLAVTSGFILFLLCAIFLGVTSGSRRGGGGSEISLSGLRLSPTTLSRSLFGRWEHEEGVRECHSADECVAAAKNSPAPLSKYQVEMSEATSCLKVEVKDFFSVMMVLWLRTRDGASCSVSLAGRKLRLTRASRHFKDLSLSHIAVVMHWR